MLDLVDLMGRRQAFECPTMVVVCFGLTGTHLGVTIYVSVSGLDGRFCAFFLNMGAFAHSEET